MRFRRAPVAGGCEPGTGVAPRSVHLADLVDVERLRLRLRSPEPPAFCFGHGLSYTDWSLSALRAPARLAVGRGLPLRIEVANTGLRHGRQVVQVYLSQQASVIERPALWLAAHATIDGSPGTTTSATIGVLARAFAHWTDEGWCQEPGSFTVRVGTSLEHLPLSVPVEVDPELA